MKMPLNHQITHIAAVLDLDGVHPDRLHKEPAVARARRLARRTRSALTVLAFAPPPTLAGIRNLIGSQESERSQVHFRAALFDLAARIQREEGITALTELRTARFDAGVIADWLASSAVDVAVLTKPDEAATAATTMNRLSVLIRQTGIPVWFAERGTQPQAGVIAALSRGAEEPLGEVRALDYEVMDTARGVGKLFDAELHVVQACDRSMWEAPRTSRENALKSFAMAIGAADEVEEIVVAEGKTAEVISESAEALEAGLIVMGASEKSRWEAMLLGGAAEETLTLAPCDVLFVKNAEGEQVRPQTLLSGRVVEAEPELTEVDLVVDPRRHFATPLALVRDECLDRQSKVVILEAWREELQNEEANDRNMPQQVYETVANGRELAQVESALVRLGATDLAAA